jgi:hypothetical protein
LETTEILHGVQLSGSPISRIFKVGVWVGVIIAAVIVGVVIWLLRSAGARERDAGDRTRDGRERERAAYGACTIRESGARARLERHGGTESQRIAKIAIIANIENAGKMTSCRWPSSQRRLAEARLSRPYRLPLRAPHRNDSLTAA